MPSPCSRCGKRAHAIRRIVSDSKKGLNASTAKKAAVVGTSMLRDARRAAANRLGFRRSR